MSETDPRCQPSRSGDCPPPLPGPQLQLIPTRDAVLGESMTIRRALPSRLRRMIGAWCFLDHFGPADVGGGDGLRVGPHPHTGLQTFTWVLQGEILHRDSLGVEQLIRPGQVNLMTAGRGISHSEESPAQRGTRLHGAQLWIALPDGVRHTVPDFAHYPELPVLERGGFRLTVLAGGLLGQRAPTQLYSPLLGLDLHAERAADLHLPLDPGFEHGALVLEGEVTVEDQPLPIGQLLYLGLGREQLRIRCAAPARLLLIGGAPFGEEILLWWNFVGRSRAELTQAVRDWNAGHGFGEVRGYPGTRLQSPLPPWAD
jgi:quercetin 2,3-dioxygenase